MGLHRHTDVHPRCTDRTQGGAEFWPAPAARDTDVAGLVAGLNFGCNQEVGAHSELSKRLRGGAG